MSCPSQHLKWLEQNILQGRQKMEQLEGWSKLQRILLWKLHVSHHHVSWRKREGFRPGTVALREIRWYQKSTETIDQKGSIPMSHIWSHVRHQEWPKNSGSGNKRFAGSSRGLFSRPVWRFQPVCYLCNLCAKWVTIMPRDVQLARRICGERT